MILLELLFRGDKEFVHYKINREQKELWLKSTKTGGEFKKLHWRKLFDPGKERIQELLTNRMDDNRFIKNIVFFMAKKGGYELVRLVK